MSYFSQIFATSLDNAIFTSRKVFSTNFEISTTFTDDEMILDVQFLRDNEVTIEASFTNDLGADSLDTVELIMQFEDDFNIEIPDDDAEKILSVGQANDYINKLR